MLDAAQKYAPQKKDGFRRYELLPDTCFPLFPQLLGRKRGRGGGLIIEDRRTCTVGKKEMQSS